MLSIPRPAARRSRPPPRRQGRSRPTTGLGPSSPTTMATMTTVADLGRSPSSPRRRGGRGHQVVVKTPRDRRGRCPAADARRWMPRSSSRGRGMEGPLGGHDRDRRPVRITSGDQQGRTCGRRSRLAKAIELGESSPRPQEGIVSLHSGRPATRDQTRTPAAALPLGDEGHRPSATRSWRAPRPAGFPAGDHRSRPAATSVEGTQLLRRPASTSPSTTRRSKQSAGTPPKRSFDCSTGLLRGPQWRPRLA
jgi:hypothetical protein